MSETPFKIHIPDSEIGLLKQKLALTRFPDELEDVGRDYGVPLADLKRLLARWTDGYDWRRFEDEANKLPQFKRTIEVEGFDRLEIHYVHQKSTVQGAIPLLFVHGWPGSFIEVTKILNMLTDPKDPEVPSFHVVALSLPGYGFSAAPKKRGFGIAQYAEVGNKLMISLGYEQYVTQGGDWGAHITKRLAILYGGKNSMAWHTNFVRAARMAAPPTFLSGPLAYLRYLVTPYTDADREGFKRSEWFLNEGKGYALEQGTQPQTIGYSLADSPAGLLAWIYEKLVNWTDAYLWEDDEILDWVSIYWFSTAGPAASLRIYYEMHHGPNAFDTIPTIPTGYSHFPKELYKYPRSWTTTPHVVFESSHPSGGHFAAHEKPDELVGDLRKMFGKGGPAFGVVPKKNGYAD